MKLIRPSPDHDSDCSALKLPSTLRIFPLETHGCALGGGGGGLIGGQFGFGPQSGLHTFYDATGKNVATIILLMTLFSTLVRGWL